MRRVNGFQPLAGVCCILRLSAKPQISAGRMCEKFSETIEMCLCMNGTFTPGALADIYFIFIVIRIGVSLGVVPVMFGDAFG